MRDDHIYSPTRASLDPNYIGGYACDNLCMSLHCIYNTKTFEEAVLKVINLCGDSDTTGSVTAQIAGAIYGIENVPQDALNAVLNWDQGEIGLRTLYLMKIKL